MKEIRVDICAIGGGSSGLAVVGRAARMGADAVLVEKGRMGGDCLNYGCVPSKALLAAGRAAQVAREAWKFGVFVPEPWVNPEKVQRHVHQVMAAIAPNDSAERLESYGAKVINAEARFVDRETLEADGVRIKAKRFVVCTGTSPDIPLIPGLAQTPHLTNETLFYSKSFPSHLIVIGGGPIGAEMAQAHRNLGAKVTVLEAQRLLGRDDAELVDIVRKRLVAELVDLRESTAVREVKATNSGVEILLDGGERIEGSHILVATGRRANTEGLELERADVAYDRKAVKVDRRLRTTNRQIYAVGDVTGHYQFAHMAGYQAWIVLRNALFGWPAKVSYDAVPWVTFTHPELAWVGLSEAEARERHGRVKVLRWPLAQNDRAQCDRDTDGMVKAVVLPKGQVVGAGIVAPGAGDQLFVWALLVARRIRIGQFVRTVMPYPTYGYASKYAADSFYENVLFGPRMKKLYRFINKIRL